MTPAAARDRAAAVLRELAAGRRVADAQLHQHARDCAALCEEAYAAFELRRLQEDRDEAVLWNLRGMRALAALSDDWRLARDAEILAAIGASFLFDGARSPRAANDREAREQ